MEIIEVNSFEEMTANNNCYYELEGKFYTHCFDCGAPIKINNRTKRHLKNDDYKDETFCSVKCAYNWQTDTSCCEPGCACFPYFVKCVETNELLTYHQKLEQAEQQLERFKQLDTSRGNHNKYNYVIIDLNEVTQPFVIRCRENGDVIDRFPSLEITERRLLDYENRDKKNGDFEPNFYEIYDENKEEIIH